MPSKICRRIDVFSVGFMHTGTRRCYTVSGTKGVAFSILTVALGIFIWKYGPLSGQFVHIC